MSAPPYRDPYTGYAAGLREGRRQADRDLLAACEGTLAWIEAIEIAYDAQGEALDREPPMLVLHAAITKAKGEEGERDGPRSV